MELLRLSGALRALSTKAQAQEVGGQGGNREDAGDRCKLPGLAATEKEGANGALGAAEMGEDGPPPADDVERVADAIPEASGVYELEDGVKVALGGVDTAVEHGETEAVGQRRREEKRLTGRVREYVKAGIKAHHRGMREERDILRVDHVHPGVTLQLQEAPTRPAPVGVKGAVHANDAISRTRRGLCSATESAKMRQGTETLEKQVQREQREGAQLTEPRVGGKRNGLPRAESAACLKEAPDGPLQDTGRGHQRDEGEQELELDAIAPRQVKAELESAEARAVREGKSIAARRTHDPRDDVNAGDLHSGGVQVPTDSKRGRPSVETDGPAVDHGSPERADAHGRVRLDRTVDAKHVEGSS
jgi:hypothetical protein